MSASVRLEAAMLDAVEALLEVIGLPVSEDNECGPRRPVSGSLVCRDEVPDSAWRAACFGMMYLMVGAGILDPDAGSVVSVEDGLAALTGDAGS